MNSSDLGRTPGDGLSSPGTLAASTAPAVRPPEGGPVAARPLPSPGTLRRRLPLGPAAQRGVAAGRRAVRRVLSGDDDRLLVVVGPCSVHDPSATLDFAARLARAARPLDGDVLCVMRVYTEKPRTEIGWRGLVSDPGLDGSGRMEDGLALARGVLLGVARLGLPVGCEFLDPVVAPYLVDVAAWGVIGARTVESQVHRQLASGLPMAVGLKNATTGCVQPAIEALQAVARGHAGAGIDEAGRACVVVTAGNPQGHLVLRGGSGGPNYGPEAVTLARQRLAQAGLLDRVMIDASHGNSDKDHVRQRQVAGEVAHRLAAGEPGLAGVMLESFLVAGRQQLVGAGAGSLTYGQSVTDPCMGWEETEAVLDELAQAVRTRRART